MIEIDTRRAQELREKIDRALRGEPIQNAVGALEMVIVDVLVSIPGATETSAFRGVEAIAGDVRNIVAERFAAVRSAH